MVMVAIRRSKKTQHDFRGNFDLLKLCDRLVLVYFMADYTHRSVPTGTAVCLQLTAAATASCEQLPLLFSGRGVSHSTRSVICVYVFRLHHHQAHVRRGWRPGGQELRGELRMREARAVRTHLS